MKPDKCKSWLCRIGLVACDEHSEEYGRTDEEISKQEAEARTLGEYNDE